MKISAVLVGALLARTMHLQRKANRHTAFRRELEEMAQAFHTPGWDYERHEWREPLRALAS